MLIFMGIVQFGAIMFYYNTMSQVAGQTARLMALDQLSTESAVSAHVTGALPNWGFTASVTPTFGADDVRVEITARLADMSIVDVLGIFSEEIVVATAEMRK
jgi:hypothetical protein